MTDNPWTQAPPNQEPQMAPPPQQQPQMQQAAPPPRAPENAPDEASMFQAFVLHYLTIIFPLIIIFSPRQKDNKFLRFYAMQSIFAIISVILVSIVFSAGGSIVGTIIGLVMKQGAVIPIVFAVLGGIVALVWDMIVLVCLIIASLKAYNGSVFKIPLVGKIAEKKVFGA